MQEDSSNRNENESISPRAQAGRLHKRVQDLILDIDQARDRDFSEDKPPPSLYALALAADVASLLEGISEGWIDSGQERIASGLLLGVADLVASGHSGLAASFTSVLRVVSSQGLAAANCSISRKRIGPATSVNDPSLE